MPKSLFWLFIHCWYLPTKATVFCFLLFTLQLSAQNAQLYFRNYTTDHGLPSSEVHCIFEDSKGYIWIGTDNGASRFDGYEFDNFGAKEGLTSNVVFKIMEDNKGRILFGTMTAEIFVFDGDSIRLWEQNVKLDQYNKNNREAKFYHKDKNDNLYIGIKFEGICKIGKKDSYFLKRPSNGILNLHIDGYAYPMGVRKSVSPSSKVFFIDKDLSVTSQVNFKSYDKSYPVSSYQFSDSTSIIITNDSIFHFNTDYRIDKIQKFNYDQCIILRDDKVNFWFGFTNGNGLRIYSDKNAIFHSDFSHYLENQAITTLFQTKNKEIWIGSRENGIYIASNSRQKIINKKSGLTSDHVSSIDFIDETNLVLGTNQGEVQLLNTNSFELKNLDFPRSNYEPKYIYDIAFFDQKIWAGSLHYIKNRWMPNSKLGIPRIIQKKIYITINNPSIWLIDNFKLIQYSPHYAEKIFDSRFDINHNLERTFCFMKKKFRTFVGNTKGLFELKNDSLIKVPMDHPSFNVRIEDIDQLPNGDITFGTKGRGLAIWRNDTIVDLNTDHGLASNMVEDVHVDKFGYIWVATLNGMSKVDFDTTNNTAKIRTFTIHNGLPSNEVYQIKSYDDQVWVCTAKGLLKWEDPPINAVSKRPMIIKIVQNDLNLDTSNHALKFDQNNFEFNYLTINIKQDGNIPYRYRLRESDDWTYSSNRSVNYPELRPGQYTFEVQSQNEDYFWSQSAVYDFSINKPWWQQTWFIVISVLGLGGIVYLFNRSRLRAIRQEQKVAKLQQSALQAQMNPHFIFNCLNSIQSYINQNDKKKANLYLVSFARLVRGCLSASREKKIPLDQELGILENYLELEKMRFKMRSITLFRLMRILTNLILKCHP